MSGDGEQNKIGEESISVCEKCEYSGDTGDDKLVTEERIIRVLVDDSVPKKVRSKRNSKLSLHCIRNKCRTTVQSLEQKYDKLKLELEQSEAKVAEEKLKQYRLKKIAEVTNEMINNREIILAKSFDDLWNQVNRIDYETEFAEFHAHSLVRENYLLKACIKILNTVNFSWFVNRICCSGSFRFG